MLTTRRRPTPGKSDWTSAQKGVARFKSAGLLHGEGLDLVAGDFDFDAVGWARIVAVHRGAAHHDVSGQLLELQRIEHRLAARVYDHGMFGRESVFGRELREVIYVF
jgi:hypothetical protein